MKFGKRGKKAKEKSNIQKLAEEAKAEAKEEKKVKKRQSGETAYICIECGGNLRKHNSGRHHPGFLIRNFKCDDCHRETDQYVTKVKIVRL